MYGDTWVEKVKNSSFVSKLCCISELIRFMVKEWGEIMKGSVYEVFLIVHDALGLLTEKKMITWMQKTITYIDGCRNLMDFKMGRLIIDT